MRRATACAGAVIVLITGTSMFLRFSNGDADEAKSTTPVRVDQPSPAPPVGPARVVEGVPHGWRHDADGAEAAAVAAIALTGKLATSGFITRSDIIRSIATEAFGPTLATASSGQLSEMSAELGTAGVSASELVWAELPLTTRVVISDARRTVVEVWAVLVVGVPDAGAARQAWRTVTVELAWEREDWRIDGWQARSGPTPALASAVEIATVDDLAEVISWHSISGGS